MIDDLNLTDLRLSQNDYWYDVYPTDNNKPFIRPCKVAGVRRIYFFDTESEVWAYVQLV